MFFLYSALSLTLILPGLPFCIGTTFTTTELLEGDNTLDADNFQKLLDQVDPPALHAALHDFSPNKFKHGMFPEDRSAVEALHKEEPKIATGIIRMANLAKRQDVNNGTAATSSSPPSTPVDSSSTESTAADSSAIESASTRATPVPQGSEVLSSSPAATLSTVAPTTNSPVIVPSPSAGSDESQSIASVAAPSASSNESPISSAAPAEGSSTPENTSMTPSPTSNSLTAGEVITTTNGVGLVVVSTVGGGVSTETPSGFAQSTSVATHGVSSKTSTLIQTSTLPNGSKSTITAVTVIPAATSTEETPSGSAGAAATGTASGAPGLQTGEAAMTRGVGREMALVLGGAIGFAMMM